MKQKKDKTRLLYALPLLLFLFLAITAVLAMQKSTASMSFGHPPIPQFSIAGLGDHDLPDDIAIVNFFASWCAPCEAEHPYITDLAQNTPVYGIAFMDEATDTDAFLSRLGNPYKVVGNDIDGIAGARWGVYGVPTTFVIHNGDILYQHDGPLLPGDIEEYIRPLLEDDQ